MTLPIPSTRFIGREHELAEIISLLNDPTCRLLTLVGPGGSGKTRLALEIASQVGTKCKNGAYFVPLHPVASRDMFISATIDAMNHSLYGQQDLEIQLLNFLRDKQALLILDNFEHLLKLTALIAEMLEEAPRMTLLVTSRETLNLREEWLFPVSGMAYPKSSRDNFAKFSAVQLFLEHARRVRRDFSFEREQEHIIQICQAVEGLPLGIELAASWLRVLPCEAIVTEIQDNLDFLATKLRNIPERHRSMRAVFEQSWKLLNETERKVFKRLSVFGGSFGRDAASEIAAASLTVLSALVDKSLLKTTPQGRYQIHELLRQYGYEKLRENPEDVEIINARHCHYYAAFALQKHGPILSSSQRETLQELTIEIENIQAAWRYAVSNTLITNIEKMVSTYYLFCDLQSRYQEVIELNEYALNHLTQLPASEEVNLLISMLLSYLGWGHIRVGRYEDSMEAFTRSLKILQQSNSTPKLGFGTNPLAGLCLLHDILGNYEDALEYGEQARQQSEATDDKLNLPIALYALAGAAFAQGAYDKATTHARQAIVITRSQNHHWMTAYVLTILGNVARAQGDYEQAKQCYLESYSIKEALDDPEGMAAALNQLGEIALRQHDPEEAARLYKRSLDIYQQIYDRGGLATAQKGAANAAVGAGDIKAAYAYFSQALQTAADIQYMPLILAILADIGAIMLTTNLVTNAIELLTLVLRHRASEHETHEQARSALSNAGIVLDSEDASPLEISAADLKPLLDSLQAELAAPDRHSPLATKNQKGPDQQTLIDPLSERELEVLHLLARGMTNQVIADELFIVVGTVKAHNHNIFNKLGVSNRVQAITRARQLGLLD